MTSLDQPHTLSNSFPIQRGDLGLAVTSLKRVEDEKPNPCSLDKARVYEACTTKLTLALCVEFDTETQIPVNPISNSFLETLSVLNTNMRRTPQMWDEGVIQELARVKRSMLRRNTRLRSAQVATRVNVGDNDAGSLVSSAESSLRGRVYSDIGAGVADSKVDGKIKSGGGRGGEGRRSRDGNGTTFSAEPRFSRFALSLSIPRPKQHNGLTSADVVDPSRGGEAGGVHSKEDSSKNSGTSRTSSNDNRGGDGGGHARQTSTGKNGQNSSSGTATAAAEASAAVGSKLRLDIVRADVERNTGLSPRSPRPGAEGGGSTPAGMAAAPARFDSAARELLQGYEDEQVFVVLGEFWQ